MAAWAETGGRGLAAAMEPAECKDLIFPLVGQDGSQHSGDPWVPKCVLNPI